MSTNATIPPQPPQPPPEDPAVTAVAPVSNLVSNKQLAGIVALVITALLGAPPNIFATKGDVDSIQQKVDILTRKVSDLEANLQTATRTGDKLTKVIEDKMIPEIRRLATEEQIRKALRQEREKSANHRPRATMRDHE